MSMSSRMPCSRTAAHTSTSSGWSSGSPHSTTRDTPRACQLGVQRATSAADRVFPGASRQMSHIRHRALHPLLIQKKIRLTSAARLDSCPDSTAGVSWFRSRWVPLPSVTDNFLLPSQ